ncbi:MAG: PLP-dependent aminotransferase family protein [Clostridiales bacterium]|nr:PLP-dependent aminotransferase family protein [Clostridiales bacterium]
MEKLLSDTIKAIPASYVAEILEAAADPGIISLAGGLPHPLSFPKEDLLASINRIIETDGDKVFQYSSTQGLPALREFIADRYNKKYNIGITADDILITSGSQQALDIISKSLTNKGDAVVVENPTYLAAIQIFAQYQPEFVTIDLNEEGPDFDQLEAAMKKNPKFIYLIPNFQNPTGLTYTKEARDKVYELIKGTDTFLIEDDPYGEIRYSGQPLPYIGMGRHENSIVLGTFSKTATPGMRIGFIICKNKEFMKALMVAKECADLHTNIFGQYMLADYVTHNDYDAHIERIVALYKQNAEAMVAAMEKYFPEEVTYTVPEGGMFLWVTFPEKVKAMKLAPKAIEKGVIFVPGDAFYVSIPEGAHTARLNYTNASLEKIDEGIKKLADAISEIMAE